MSTLDIKASDVLKWLASWVPPEGIRIVAFSAWRDHHPTDGPFLRVSADIADGLPGSAYRMLCTPGHSCEATERAFHGWLTEGAAKAFPPTIESPPPIKFREFLG